MSDPKTVLIVEDEKNIVDILRFNLQRAGYQTLEAYDGEDGLAQAVSANPDLILLDVMLPKKNGFDVCRAIRRVSDAPIVMLTSRSDTSDVVTGLEAGADDYVPKPFKPKELVARVRARLRGREDSQADEGLALQDLSIDVSGHIVKREGRVIALTPLEFDLLVTLARSPWKVFSREELLEQVWGYRHAADTRLVNVQVQRLRSKMERDPERPELVVTVRGVGYRAGAGA